MVRSSKNVIKEFMRFKVRMEGTVNGHEFEIEGEGEGRPYEGHNTVKLKVTKGGPLPFAWDILSPQFQYGSKVYVKHPADIPDYKKLSFPEGFKWERVMNFEDGGVVTVTQDSSLQDGCFIYKVKFIGVNFPSDGPVMQKKTMGWEASTERLYPRDGVLKGEIHKALKLKDGGHYLVEFKSIYMAKKPVQLPGYYYVDSKLDITSHNEDYTIVEQYERTEGRHHLFLLRSRAMPMSFVQTIPEFVAAAATDLARIGTTITSANATAMGPTSAVLAPGADEVSASIAALFDAHSQVYQALSAQAAAFHSQFVQLMNGGAMQYAGSTGSR
ncbi:PE domain-containing protein [Acinetobacter baumannii]|nr:PE domain-containing protein [Acinetobacter baumannii]